MGRKISRYGWIPDLPDHRDYLYAAPLAIAGALSASIDLRSQLKQKAGQIFTPSRLFIYYNERAIEHTVTLDSGAQIRDGIKSVATQGDCPEPEWPYVIAKFKTKPSKSCYADALKYKAASYQRLTPVLSQLTGCLASGSIHLFSALRSMKILKARKPPKPAMRLCRIKWGMNGYFTLPRPYLISANLASDFWTIRVVQ